ncbi:hypothetical protein [Sphingomonas sp. LC-1]|uniref:hypothetical protein n=1 Tax=Sphingomonas sp. LC-1 TaxID=3110957 RepID=UPI0021BB4738|nr:hypothetical protein [Sphingomonas sp. LC-1]
MSLLPEAQPPNMIPGGKPALVLDIGRCHAASVHLDGPDLTYQAGRLNRPMVAIAM